MLRFTFDTNAIVDLEEGRPAAPHIRQLIDAHEHGQADVALVAISASEKQRGAPISNFLDFKDKLSRIGLDHLTLLKPIAHFDLTFWDWSLWSSDAIAAQAQRIHDVLFSTVPYMTTTTRDDEGDKAAEYWKWRNAKCDVLAMWSHINEGRDVFVTRDDNFMKATKRPALVELGAGKILTPADAVALLS